MIIGLCIVSMLLSVIQVRCKISKYLKITLSSPHSEFSPFKNAVHLPINQIFGNLFSTLSQHNWLFVYFVQSDLSVLRMMRMQKCKNLSII